MIGSLHNRVIAELSNCAGLSVRKSALIRVHLRRKVLIFRYGMLSTQNAQPQGYASSKQKTLKYQTGFYRPKYLALISV